MKGHEAVLAAQDIIVVQSVQLNTREDGRRALMVTYRCVVLLPIKIVGGSNHELIPAVAVYVPDDRRAQDVGVDENKALVRLVGRREV